MAPPPDGPPLWRKCLIFATYSVSIWCVGLPPPLYPAMQKDLGFSSGAVAGILAFETAGTAVGKTVAGFWTDALGARRAYCMTACALAACALVFSWTTSVATVSLAVFALEVVNAPAWPAHARILHGWYPPRPVEILLQKYFFFFRLNALHCTQLRPVDAHSC